MPIDLQPKFRTFHQTIKLGFNDQGSTLRSKRDIVLNLLRKRLKERFSSGTPTFEHRNQGSYAMHTGIHPLDGDYDLDVALLFHLSKDDHPDPVEVKLWVLDALDGHTKQVEMMRPCVRVQYQQKGEPLYHLDLAIYAADNSDGETYLAKGFKGSSDANREWHLSDPMALVHALDGKFSGEDRDQFRRTICSLKRWKDHRFPSAGEAAPRGIGITAAVFHSFRPTWSWAERKRADRDLDALLAVVNTMRRGFTYQGQEDGEAVYRYEGKLPVPPYDDPFDRMSNKQMGAFRTKLDELRIALQQAKDSIDPVEACEILRAQFGTDFPEADPGEGGKKSSKVLVGSSKSA